MLMLKRAVVRLAVCSFAAYGAFWTLVNSAGSFLSVLKPTGLMAYLILVGTSIIIGIWRAWPPSSVEILVPNSDSSVIVQFGDIFRKPGCIAIQVNEFFDSKLGEHVSPNSLHGKFIRDVLGGQSEAFDSLVQTALSAIPYDAVERDRGRSRRYRIGTTAPIDINGKRFFLFALTKTDVNTLKANATIDELWAALAGLWEEIRVRSNGEPVNVPLVGNGLSGVGLPPTTLLNLLLISYFYHTKKHKITDQLTIVLHPSLRYDIDLRSLKESTGR